MERYIFQSLLHQFRTGAEEYLKEYEKKPTHNKISERVLTMAKPTAKSTVSAMKDYIRVNQLNKAPIRLGMKRDELIAGLRKLGHWDAQHDGVAPRRKAPAPKKPKAPAPPPKRARVVAGPVDLQGERQDKGEGDRGEVRAKQKMNCDDQMREAKNYIELDERRYTKTAMKYAGSDDTGSSFKRILDFANYDRNVIRIRNVCGIDHANTYKKAYAIYKKNGDKYIPEKKPKAPAPKAPAPKAPVRAIEDKKEAKPKKEKVDRIQRNRLMDDFKREHKGKTVWKILTLKPTATRDAIRARGRELMRKNHPDKGGNKETFQTIQQAVKLLMDTFV